MNNEKTWRQLLIINLLLLLFWNSAVTSTYTTKEHYVVIFVVTFFMNAAFFYCLEKIDLVCMVKEIINYLNKNKGLVIIFVIMAICSATAYKSWLNIDGYIYYSGLRRIKSWDFVSFNSLMIGGHHSQAYAALLLIGEYLFPNNIIGVRIVLFVMAIVAVYCFYEIVSSILVINNIIEKSLLTGLYAFAPLFLGLLMEVNTDFPLLCFFTCLVCCGLKKCYILQAFCGFLLCFSKETGCVLYGAYFIGILIYRIKTNIKNFNLVKKLFSHDIILLSSGGVTWLLNYFLNRNLGWMNKAVVRMGTQNEHYLNSFGIYPRYILYKLSEMMFLNFNWILYGFVLLTISVLVIYGSSSLFKKTNVKNEVCVGIITSFISFIIYSTLYITYVHARYLIPLVFFMAFCGVVSIVVLVDKKKMRIIILAIINMVFLISNFYSVDPISNNLFLSENTGKSVIFIPNTVSIADDIFNLNNNRSYEKAVINTSGMYNLQCEHLSVCFDKSLEKINYTEDTLIILPRQYREEYGTLVSIFGINISGVGINELYWDSVKKTVNINCADNIQEMRRDGRYRKLNIRVLNNISELRKEDVSRYRHIYYFELPFQKDFNHLEYTEGIKIVDRTKTEYFSWRWYIDKLK